VEQDEIIDDPLSLTPFLPSSTAVPSFVRPLASISSPLPWVLCLRHTLYFIFIQMRVANGSRLSYSGHLGDLGVGVDIQGFAY
jgi:hypothetical protein